MDQKKQPQAAVEPSPTEQTPLSKKEAYAAKKAVSIAKDGPTLTRAMQLLQSKNDTHRIIGLAMIQSFLDKSVELREDTEVIVEIWRALPLAFLDWLIRKGLEPVSASIAEDDNEKSVQWENAKPKDMLDLAVSVLHKFVTLVGDNQKKGTRFSKRIPILVEALLKSSPETTTMILQILISLTVYSEGANEFSEIEDISPLVELAPQHPEALDVLCNAWVGASSFGTTSIKEDLMQVIDDNLITLCLGFKGTDAVTLLAFTGRLFRDLDPQFLPESPKWLSMLTAFIHNLIPKRPSAEARNAYTTAAAALLMAYTTEASTLLFKPDTVSDQKPASYLLLNLVLIDIRSSMPTLLEALNSPTYAPMSYRLSCAFDIISSFTGFLIRCMDFEDDAPLPMEPDLLLKLRKSVGETMSVTLEYLRDRWDAAHAGAMGLHRDARSSATHTSTGITRLPIAWDSVTGEVIEEDTLVLAALRALAVWIQEDDGELLRKETSGLCDMLFELYQSSTAASKASVINPKKLDFRPPVLVIAIALAQTDDDCIETLLKNDAWTILAKDFCSIINSRSTYDAEEAMRGTEIIQVFISIVEASSTRDDEWLDLVTTIAAWDMSKSVNPPEPVLEFQIAAMQLVCTLLGDSVLSPLVVRRYTHSIESIQNLAEVVAGSISSNDPMRESIENVMGALSLI